MLFLTRSQTDSKALFHHLICVREQLFCRLHVRQQRKPCCRNPCLGIVYSLPLYVYLSSFNPPHIGNRSGEDLFHISLHDCHMHSVPSQTMLFSSAPSSLIFTLTLSFCKVSTKVHLTIFTVAAFQWMSRQGQSRLFIHNIQYFVYGRTSGRANLFYL